MKSLRKILKQNEIFFTTITAVLLSVMAIVMTNNSNKIAKQQLKLSNAENQPDFEVSGCYYIDPKINKAVDYELTISNKSGIAKNTNIRTVTYLSISFSDSVGANFTNEFKLRYYLDIRDNPKNKGNNIAVFRAPENKG